MAKKNKRKKNRKHKPNNYGKVNLNRGDFDWMIGISKRVDKYIQQINNRLRAGESLDDMMYDTRKSIDRKYQNYYHYHNYGVYNTNTLQSINTSKEKYNIMVDMYNQEFEQKPWYIRLIRRKNRKKTTKFEL
jgi:prolyl oligopeptidase PreP (S9A serine peptidase family)